VCCSVLQRVAERWRVSQCVRLFKIQIRPAPQETTTSCKDSSLPSEGAEKDPSSAQKIFGHTYMHTHTHTQPKHKHTFSHSLSLFLSIFLVCVPFSLSLSLSHTHTNTHTPCIYTNHPLSHTWGRVCAKVARAHTHTHTTRDTHTHREEDYGVATMNRLLNITGLFGKKAL